MLKDRLPKTSGWQFHKWLFGPEKFSGRSRNGPLAICVETHVLHVSSSLIYNNNNDDDDNDDDNNNNNKC